MSPAVKRCTSLDRLSSAATRDSAVQLGMVTLDQMIAALTTAVKDPADGVRIVSVPRIHRAGLPERTS